MLGNLQHIQRCNDVTLQMLSRLWKSIPVVEGLLVEPTTKKPYQHQPWTSTWFALGKRFVVSEQWLVRWYKIAWKTKPGILVLYPNTIWGITRDKCTLPHEHYVTERKGGETENLSLVSAEISDWPTNTKPRCVPLLTSLGLMHSNLAVWAE